MAVPSPSLKPTPYGVKGIQYYPIASSTLLPPSTGIGHLGVTEKSFSFASSGQSAPYDYLTINLLEYSNPTQSINNLNYRDKFPPSTIIVRGHIMALPNGDYGSDIDEIDSAYFEHVFLTDWQSSSIWTPISSIYSFEDQNNAPNTNPSPSDTWVPEGTHNGWVNGSQAESGNAWESGLTTKAWNIGIGGQFSTANGTGTPSNNTGPSGGVGTDDTPGGSSSGAQKFLYTESSNPNNSVNIVWLTRTPGINISASMADPTNNSARLRFKVHAFGIDIGELKVYVDTFAQSTSTQASLLEEYPSDNWNQITGTDPYEEVIIDLPSNITQTDDDYYFFITHQLSNNSFKGDLAIDRIVFEEEVIAPNYTSGFYQEIASGNNGTLITEGDPSVQFNWDGSPTGNANVTFTLYTDDGAYIKATYLLM